MEKPLSFESVINTVRVKVEILNWDSFCLLFEIPKTKSLKAFPRLSANIGSGIIVHFLSGAAVWCCKEPVLQANTALYPPLLQVLKLICALSSQHLFILFITTISLAPCPCHSAGGLVGKIDLITIRNACWGWAWCRTMSRQIVPRWGKTSLLWPIFSFGNSVSLMLPYISSETSVLKNFMIYKSVFWPSSLSK